MFLFIIGVGFSPTCIEAMRVLGLTLTHKDFMNKMYATVDTLDDILGMTGGVILSMDNAQFYLKVKRTASADGSRSEMHVNTAIISERSKFTPEGTGLDTRSGWCDIEFMYRDSKLGTYTSSASNSTRQISSSSHILATCDASFTCKSNEINSKKFLNEHEMLESRSAYFWGCHLKKLVESFKDDPTNFRIKCLASERLKKIISLSPTFVDPSFRNFNSKSSNPYHAETKRASQFRSCVTKNNCAQKGGLMDAMVTIAAARYKSRRRNPGNNHKDIVAKKLATIWEDLLEHDNEDDGDGDDDEVVYNSFLNGLTSPPGDEDSSDDSDASHDSEFSDHSASSASSRDTTSSNDGSLMTSDEINAKPTNDEDVSSFMEMMRIGIAKDPNFGCSNDDNLGRSDDASSSNLSSINDAKNGEFYEQLAAGIESLEIFDEIHDMEFLRNELVVEKQRSTCDERVSNGDGILPTNKVEILQKSICTKVANIRESLSQSSAIKSDASLASLLEKFEKYSRALALNQDAILQADNFISSNSRMDVEDLDFKEALQRSKDAKIAIDAIITLAESDSDVDEATLFVPFKNMPVIARQELYTLPQDTNMYGDQKMIEMIGNNIMRSVNAISSARNSEERSQMTLVVQEWLSISVQGGQFHFAGAILDAMTRLYWHCGISYIARAVNRISGLDPENVMGAYQKFQLLYRIIAEARIRVVLIRWLESDNFPKIDNEIDESGDESVSGISLDENENEIALDEMTLFDIKGNMRMQVFVDNLAPFWKCSTSRDPDEVVALLRIIDCKQNDIGTFLRVRKRNCEPAQDQLYRAEHVKVLLGVPAYDRAYTIYGARSPETVQEDKEASLMYPIDYLANFNEDDKQITSLSTCGAKWVNIVVESEQLDPDSLEMTIISKVVGKWICACKIEYLASSTSSVTKHFSL